MATSFPSPNVLRLQLNSYVRLPADDAIIFAGRKIRIGISGTSRKISTIQTRWPTGYLAPLRFGRRDKRGETACRCDPHRIPESSPCNLDHYKNRSGSYAKIFADETDAIFYSLSIGNSAFAALLANYKPSLMLLMETEIWPRFIREAKLSGAGVAIVNGRLSRKSYDRYSMVRSFVAKVVANVHMAIMQDKADPRRLIDLGIDKSKVFVSGNLKFEQSSAEAEADLTAESRHRFGISNDKLLVIAASTHEPEEQFVIESLEGMLGERCRLLIAPRHPGKGSTKSRNSDKIRIRVCTAISS